MKCLFFNQKIPKHKNLYERIIKIMKKKSVFLIRLLHNGSVSGDNILYFIVRCL